MEEERKAKMRGLSRAVAVIAMIIRVISIVGIVCVTIGMIAVGIVGSTVKIENNQIKIVGQVINYEKNEDEVIFRVTYKGKQYEEKVTKDTEVLLLNKALNFVEEKNIGFMIIIAELVLAFSVAVLVMSAIIFKEVYKLFNDIQKNKTPFTLENVERIKKIAILLIIATAIKLSASGVIGVFANHIFNISFNLSDVVVIIIAFALSYIFEYGYSLERGSVNIINE